MRFGDYKQRENQEHMELSLLSSVGSFGSGYEYSMTPHHFDASSSRTDDLAARLQSASEFAGFGEWTWDAETDRVWLSPVAAKIFGTAEQFTTWREMQERMLNQTDAAMAAEAVQRAIDERSQYDIEYRLLGGGDRPRWVLARGRAHYSPSGRVVGMAGLVQDITLRKMQERALAEEMSALETLNRTGQIVASEHDLEKVVQAVTDAGVDVTGAQFGAFFYNVVADTGEQYMLYTISGVPREAFSRFPMPRNTPVFAPTFSGSGVVRSGNILKDPRYGTMEPHRGMPKGHLPVCSYLAVPVTAPSGEVIGGLFFGHENENVFNERHERIIVGVAAQAAVAIVKSRLLQQAHRELSERQKAENSLRGLTESLEARVRDRTKELEAANIKLQAEMAERAKAEEALRQSQRLEAVGHLTGGIAHDFNNLLTVILGNLDSVSRRLPETIDFRMSRSIQNAIEGARKASSLTGRLLAFARRQPLKPVPLDPNKLVSGMSEILSRTLGEAIEIQTVLGAGAWPTEVDATQLESAILNLAVNSRDAMPDGGKLTIETTNVSVDDIYSRANDISPGQYVAICVSDTGSGIPHDLMDKVFEPFFTTKQVGQGTGLGLSQVYGFVRQSGGSVKIYSEVNQGTTVKLYLPRYFGAVIANPVESRLFAKGDGKETVLIVEDDPLVRELAVSLFRDLGYTAIEAAEATAALAILESSKHIDLLFTDVGLPKINGRQLAEEARKRRPELRVLFTTGYARNAIVHHGRLDPGVELITKPYSYEMLAEKVRSILDDNSALRRGR
jgi:signal transduction histidine kinase